jgi:hypothetical protein
VRARCLRRISRHFGVESRGPPSALLRVAHCDAARRDRRHLVSQSHAIIGCR